MVVLFYGNREQPFGCFLSFPAQGFELDGKQWQASEHCFQAQEFAGTEHEEAVREAARPIVAARIGRARRRPVRADWEDVKGDEMRRAVLRKLESHADQRAILLGTCDEPIVENVPGDYYWGCGADGTGQNRRGQVLLEMCATPRRRADSAGTGDRSGGGGGDNSGG